MSEASPHGPCSYMRLPLLPVPDGSIQYLGLLLPY